MADVHVDLRSSGNMAEVSAYQSIDGTIDTTHEAHSPGLKVEPSRLNLTSRITV
jgi:hypothetical protein